MKYIPLTQHFETVAMLYEKCATMSEQLENLQRQNTISNGQMESEDTQQTQKKKESQQVEKSKMKQKKQTNQVEVNNDIIIEEEKSTKKPGKIDKQISKQQKQKVQLTCDHCNKIFQTEKIYNKHKYQLKYRQNLLRRKQIQQKGDAIQVEQSEIHNKKHRKEDNNKKKNISVHLNI